MVFARLSSPRQNKVIVHKEPFIDMVVSRQYDVGSPRPCMATAYTRLNYAQQSRQTESGAEKPPATIDLTITFDERSTIVERRNRLGDWDGDK